MVNVYLSGNPEHDLVLKAFYEGIHGEKKLRMVEEYKPSEVAVVFGVHKKAVPVSYYRGHVIAEQKKRSLDTVVLETGYINRGDTETNHYAAGLNGLNGRADFRNKGMPADRVLADLKPWNQGSHIIICAQVPWDASVDMTDHEDWLERAVRAIHLRTDRPVVFRPHPKCQLPPFDGTEYSTKPLAHDLARAWAVVAFNSNSGVEAVIEGVPNFAFDEGSMAWEVSNHSWDDLETPKMPDRSQWLADLGYTQWTPEELREGLAWRHLFR